MTGEVVAAGFFVCFIMAITAIVARVAFTLGLNLGLSSVRNPTERPKFAPKNQVTGLKPTGTVRKATEKERNIIKKKREEYPDNVFDYEN